MRFTMSNTFKLATFAGVLAIGGFLAASPAQAAKYSNWQDAAKHFEDCANWLVSDPAKHAKFCDPGHTIFVNATGGDGSVPVKECCWCCCNYVNSDSAFKIETTSTGEHHHHHHPK